MQLTSASAASSSDATNDLLSSELFSEEVFSSFLSVWLSSSGVGASVFLR